jgi:hypothetical protein
MRSYYPPPDLNLEQVIATFGQAQLLNNLDGKLRLVGGTPEDRAEAQAWIKLFFPREHVKGLEPETSTGP